MGGMGACIPFGSALLVIFGICLFLTKPEPDAENLLVKYDYLILLLGVFLVFSSWATPFFPNETIGTQLLPYSILENHTFYLDNYPQYTGDILYGFRFYNVGNGHYVSVLPVVIPVLITSLYAISYLLDIPFTTLT
jgi:hypothetical protein